MELNTSDNIISVNKQAWMEGTLRIVVDLRRRLMIQREGEIAKALIAMGWSPPEGYVFPSLTDLWAG